jgi:hypothetical protein
MTSHWKHRDPAAPAAGWSEFAIEWHEWNATMLPEIDDSSTGNFTGEELADHIGTKETSGKADLPVSPKTPSAKPHCGPEHCSGTTPLDLLRPWASPARESGMDVGKADKWVPDPQASEKPVTRTVIIPSSE